MLQGSRDHALDLLRLTVALWPGDRCRARLDAARCHRPFLDAAVNGDGDVRGGRRGRRALNVLC
eukprot:3270765-Pyramimonas_sp.AAC.1